MASHQLLYNGVFIIDGKATALKAYAEDVYEGRLGFEKVALNHWQKGGNTVQIVKLKETDDER